MFPATECPADHCREIRGYELDADAGCRRDTLLGCAEFGGATTDGKCFKRVSDGQLVIASSSDLADKSEYVRCTLDEERQTRVSPCD